MSFGACGASAPLAGLRPAPALPGRARQIPPSRLGEELDLQRVPLWVFFFALRPLYVHQGVWAILLSAFFIARLAPVRLVLPQKSLVAHSR